MPTKETRPEAALIPAQPPLVNLKVLERFLRILTWQMFFLLGLLFFLLLLLLVFSSRPQAGRYQVILSKDEVIVFDTATLQVVPGKPQRINGATAGDKPAPSAPSTPASPLPAAPETK